MLQNFAVMGPDFFKGPFPLRRLRKLYFPRGSGGWCHGNNKKSDSSESSEGEDEKAAVVHHGVICDGCGQTPMEGVRFKVYIIIYIMFSQKKTRENNPFRVHVQLSFFFAVIFFFLLCCVVCCVCGF